VALIAQLPVADAGIAAARALEQMLGHGVVFTPGDATFAEPTLAVLPTGDTRAVALPFGNGLAGEVTLVVTLGLATTMEAATPDASLVSAALAPLQHAARTMEPIINLAAEPDFAGEIATDTLLAGVPGDFALVPLIESDQCVACLIIRLVEDETMVAPAPAAPSPTAFAPPASMPGATVAIPDAAVPSGHGDVVRYEFQPLSDGHTPLGPTRPLALLNDVTMLVTAELGRRQMKVRELVSLEIGSVLALDKTAGSPVDVLVNGSLLAHGEVVVIDEEFGIRVSEIVVGDS
jgi:flagellar motor switch protein FliN